MKLGSSLAWLGRSIDPRDVAVFGGLAMVANGVRQVYSPAAWIAVGLFFMWISLRRKQA